MNTNTNTINNENAENIKSNQIENQDIQNFVMLLLSNNDKFNQLKSNAKINLTDEQTKQIKNILAFLNTETIGSNSKPFDNIVQVTTQTLTDGKLELHEIPLIINVIHESLKNIQSVKISTDDVGILIKLILYILIETNTIKLSTNDFDLICKIIDSSMILLNKSIEIKLPKINKCFCS